MFSHVIVKTPCTAMVHGITGHPELGAPDYEKALEHYRSIDIVNISVLL